MLFRQTNDDDDVDDDDECAAQRRTLRAPVDRCRRAVGAGLGVFEQNSARNQLRHVVTLVQPAQRRRRRRPLAGGVGSTSRTRRAHCTLP